MGSPCYHRILLKLSGEALQGEQQGLVLSPAMLEYLSNEIETIHALGTQIAIVIGGGNIVRGEMIAGDMGVERVTGDYMGMLATVINGMALRSALTKKGLDTRLQTALPLEQVAAPYIREKAIRHLEEHRVIIFAGGTGNPFFTTDTAAALRAAEVGADALLKGTNVDGVYSSDPAQNPDASRYSKLTMDEAINKKLRVMDATALTLCRDRHLSVHVFQLKKQGAMAAIIRGEQEGTKLAN